MRVVQIRYRLEGARCPLPLGHVTLFKRIYNEHPQRRNPHRVHTLLGSCPPPVTGVNLHVYPLIRAGICFPPSPLLPILLLLSQGSPSFFLPPSLFLLRCWFSVRRRLPRLPNNFPWISKVFEEKKYQDVNLSILKNY